MIIFTILFHILCNFLYFKSLFGPTYSSWAENEIVSYTAPFLVYLDYLSSFINILWIFYHRNNFAKMMKIFSEIDESFEFKLNYRKEKIKNLKTLIFVATFAISLSFCDYLALKINQTQINGYDMIFLCWSYFAQVILITSIFVIIRGIFKRVKILKLNLTNKMSIKVHFKITKIITKFNKIFSVPLFLYFANFFCWICVLTFDFVTSEVKNFGEFLAIVTMNIPHMIYMIFAIVIVVKAVENVKEEIQKCLMKIFEISDGSEEFLRFSTQIIQLPVKFSCGFIDFDWKMIFKVKIFKLNIFKFNFIYFLVHERLHHVFGNFIPISSNNEHS